MSRPDAELAHLFRQLKAPALPKLTERPRAAEWSYGELTAFSRWLGHSRPLTVLYPAASSSLR
jgi:hypothetical protein